ncbi:MAG: heme-binding protein, partial [Rhodothermales bacterium]
LKVRVAAIFGYLQAASEDSIDNLVSLSEDDAVREFALRALADRQSLRGSVPLEPFIEGLTDASDRVKVAAAIGLGRLGRAEAAEALLAVPMPAGFATPARGTEGPHATPNAAAILPHVAVRALVNLDAVDASVDAVGGAHSDLALWALRYMHHPEAVNDLIAIHKATDDAGLQRKILNTLARVYHKEAPYDASWWWGTRPDTHGPYYKTLAWEATETIEAFLLAAWRATDPESQSFFVDLNAKHRLDIPELNVPEETMTRDESESVDLTQIANKRGQIGRSSIEDVMLAITEIEPDTAMGRQLFTQQGCEMCHNLNRAEVMKGPFMGQIGAIMSRDQIAEAILAPNASISQGFATVLIITKGGESYIGFISEESADTVKMRNIAGQVFTISTNEIQSRKRMEKSMMPDGLVNSLSIEEFTSLVAFLAEQK